MLRNPTGRKERIGIFGPPGVGKSSCWVDLARCIAVTNSPGTVHVGEVDPTWDALIEEAGPAADRLSVTPMYEFRETEAWVKELKTKVQPDDWAVVDLADIIWRRAQADFTDRRYGYDLDEWFMLAAKGQGMNELGGDWGINWTIINRTYDRFIQPYLRLPCHLLVVTGDSEIQQPNRQGKGGDAPEIRDQFGRVGRKPDGQKHLPRQTHSWIYLQMKGDGTRVMSVVKDRARQLEAGIVFKSFTIDYLIRRAKWEGMADLLKAGVRP